MRCREAAKRAGFSLLLEVLPGRDLGAGGSQLLFRGRLQRLALKKHQTCLHAGFRGKLQKPPVF